MTAYAGLFAASFLAATVFPFQSELVLLGLLLSGDYPWPALLAVATVGNVLGAVVNWALGRFFLHFRDRRWFPVKPETYARVERWYARYGVWSLLFAWVPLVGDPLTVVAGALRANLVLFVVLVTVGKLGRYAVLVAATLNWM
ncbi:MAG: YqaA family protein [Reyranella sp.]|nr:YqaA family protein [Reyranella sp.]MDP3160287.1 YqaA family protein [Reyranella sp.]